MRRRRIVGKCAVFFIASGLLLAGGCAGRGDLIPVNLASKPKNGGSTGSVKSMAGPRVSVVPFEDGRTDRSNIGSRKSIWGRESHFNVPSGSPGEETAQALAEYLKKKGWQAQYSKTVPSSDDDGPDIVL